MPEQIENSAVSGEWKLVPVAQLKKWHRDMDACQKVMWLRGGFDPAYCMDAQDCLKEMEGVLAAPVPPAGGEVAVEVLGWLSVDKLMPTQQDAKEYAGYKNQSEIKELVDRAHVTRLQAKVAALQQSLNTADQRVDELQSESFEALYNAAIEERDAAQSEMAKALDLLRAIYESGSYKGEIVFRVRELLAQQSAPAAKDVES